MSNLRPLMFGFVEGGEFHFQMAPPPVEDAPVDGLLQADIDRMYDEADAAFDAPTDFSYFAHLFPTAQQLLVAVEQSFPTADEIADTEDYEEYQREIEYLRSWH